MAATESRPSTDRDAAETATPPSKATPGASRKRRDTLRKRRTERRLRRRNESDTRILTSATSYPELQNLSRHAVLGDLPVHDSRVPPDAPGEEVHRLFTEYPDLPGVIVCEGDRLYGVIARQQFFELLGRPFGIEVFMRRDIRTALEGLPHEPLVLSESCAVRTAARRALERPGMEIYHPLAVHYERGGYRLLNAQVLLLAQNQLLAHAFDAIEVQLGEAQDYVFSLLPEPMTDGPVRANWRFIPSEQLGGDTFGYHWVDEHHLAIYLLDVSGHGVGPALLSVSTLNVLHRGALPGVDFRSPASIMKGLNETFQKAETAGLFFTIWYGILDIRDGGLTYTSAGHPPAVLTPPDRSAFSQLRVPNLAIGMMPGVEYREAFTTVLPESSLYIFSDGVYEFMTRWGKVWTLEEFRKVLTAPVTGERDELERIEADLRTLMKAPTFEDDFSLLKIDFRPGG